MKNTQLLSDFEKKMRKVEQVLQGFKCGVILSEQYYHSKNF